MGYMSALHIYRQVYDYGNYTLDITGPLMILTQKLTSLAFAFHDGMKPDEQLSPDQRSQAIRHNPHIIEFLSYVFNFQGVVCGPLVYYQDYIDFIDGNSILKKKVFKYLREFY
jgi:lysophospholipid acyltransferase 1/2